jgi:Plasmid replication region DNA-binding N-term
MNHRLSDERIRSTCRELNAKHGSVSGRSLREELRRRFGAVGKTERVFQIWREESPSVAAVGLPRLPADVAELTRRLEAAEAAAAENLARAERAEYREQAHQDKWAMEVDRLRQAARGQPDQAATIRALQEQVFKLSQELAAACGRL